MMFTKDGKQNANMGCANENDCKAGQKTCEDAKKNNVRTTCTSSCCTADMCNTPPKQGEIRMRNERVLVLPSHPALCYKASFLE